MSDKDQNKWKKRVPTRIYDYNYKVGQSYYDPQKEFIESRELLSSRKAPPPEAQTYAERFANKPFYGTARGLPYDEANSVKNMPMPRRSVSARRSRASSEREVDDVPAATRTGRSRDRKLSFNLDDFFNGDSDAPKTRSKFSLDDDSDFKIPVSRFSLDRDKDRVSAADEFQIKPENKAELMKKIKDIEREFQRADQLERSSAPRVTQYEHSVWNDELNIPGKKSVKRDEVSYTDPSSGAKVHKSSYSETSKFESSKPPRAPRPARLLSIENDIDMKLPPRPRHRRISMSDISDDDFSFSPKSLGSRGEEEEKRFRKAREIRDERRAKESEELTANINKMINKMKMHADETSDVRVVRSVRASSLEPFTPRAITTARPSTKAHRFVYGYSR